MSAKCSLPIQHKRVLLLNCSGTLVLHAQRLSSDYLATAAATIKRGGLAVIFSASLVKKQRKEKRKEKKREKRKERKEKNQKKRKKRE